MSKIIKQAAIVLVLSGIFMTGGPGTWADSGNPFGFETHTHPLEYEYCKKEPGWYREHGYSCSSAPRPHPDLRSYHLMFVEGVGLCYIQARTNPGVNYPGFKRVGGYFMIRKEYRWKSHIKDQIKSLLEEIGVEQNQKNVNQLARILDSYLAQSPIFGKRFKSGDTHAALKDAFSEIKKKWFVADQSDVLTEWTRNLKRIIEKEIRSDSGNNFETFKRQILKKYGPPAPPEGDQDRYNFEATTDLIEETQSEIRAAYRRGYEWNPNKGFGGLGDVEGVELRMTSSDRGRDQVSIYFWLVTNQKCLARIDEKGAQAF